MQSTATDRILRLKAVLALTGLTRSTLYRKMEAGTFPQSIQISTRCTGWRASAIERWIDNPPPIGPPCIQTDEAAADQLARASVCFT
ncbi:helix-turn-helix transcriptional regulator [Sphingomonas sp. TDK1]|uniref:helix-turn-helix transcriptional regulator n=1 Tax=Sphingomonas sp. TDK1 TaxID=453247 RepID=UPI000A01CD97|nr:AlpA family transcriptional regulator [Sphingomonas sp. TDK1]